jgi:hypothetical protein
MKVINTTAKITAARENDMLHFIVAVSVKHPREDWKSNAQKENSENYKSI